MAQITEEPGLNEKRQRPLKVLFLLEGVTVPASRFRVMQFLPHFRRHGIEPTVVHGYGARYNAISRTRYGNAYKLASKLKLLLAAPLSARHDLVFIQRPAIPFAPVVEKLTASFNDRIIFDFDDNLTVGVDGSEHVARARTFREIISLSKRVIAGNAFLSDMARAPSKTTIIPTVIDAQSYCPGETRFASREHRVIGWMGSRNNFRSLDLYTAAFEAVLARHEDVRLRIISNAIFEPLRDHPQVEQVMWNARDEIEQLRAFDVGIMPLEDTLAARGKCGFKMIQYMAVGVPVVSSAVGANVDLFEGSGAGELVAPGGDWVAPLERLLALSASEREAMGARGRAHIEGRYSVRGVLPSYLELFEQVASS